MAELLFELLSEEIPARMQAKAAADLKRLVCDGLKEARLEFDNAKAFVTPRRLALVVDGLPTVQPDITIERKGPKVDAPEKAIQGFLRSAGVTLDQCVERETPKGNVWFVVSEEKGRATGEVLEERIPAALEKLSWAKSMRWGAGRARWVRPIHSMLCLLDGAVVPAIFHDCTAGAVTSGHAVLAGGAITVVDFADYRDRLKKSFVMLDAAERQRVIGDGAARLAVGEGLTVMPDDALVAENAGLTEWPVPLLGRIDSEFMEVPGEVLSSAMRKHQKYFSLEDKAGNFAPYFVMVANMETADAGATITAGNERVLRARLSDAKFFWDQDRKHSLSSRAPALKHIVFHAKLGTLDEKTDRIQALAVELCRYIPGSERDRVRSAARLSKADLSTEMVGEFPDLQGVMGRYYALADGEAPQVADAIAEHYAPAGPNDSCPSAPESVAVALADKIDTLVGFWLIDEKPTGSKDPYALRRAVLGVIRLILENGLRLPLKAVFVAAAQADGEAIAQELLDFFADRLKVHLKEKGVRHDLVSAVFALGGEDDLVRLMSRVDSLTGFVESEDGVHLLTAYKRAANILRIEEKKDGTSYAAAPDTALFAEEQERALHGWIVDVNERTEGALKRETYEDAMAFMSNLRQPVDDFFDHVTVNAEDAGLRKNRLNLLSEIRGTLDLVADFSKIEG
ncbi:MAG: glycine--tRNA ligase subunit beta [Alphaproteobacteria bacterium]|jgi:glycyl-tRNA synthetase beta chain|nr:glycine--tRNA ligase subunit beta [Alphaproteobacteria bacterium]MDP6590054.1 glycine--tRNA ligase subunit beta [Alphaproteobacteria bacterium]